jgi:pantoate kinase
MTITGPLGAGFFASAGVDVAAATAIAKSPDLSMECRSLTMSAVPFLCASASRQPLLRHVV